MKARHDHSTLLGLAWVSPWIVGFIAFLLVPVAMSFWYSFTDYPLVEAPIWVGLENYRELLGDPVFGIAVWNTALYAVAAVILGTGLALAIALLLHQPIPGATLARAAVYLPTLLPIVAGALAWMWILNGEFGLLNTVLDRIGIDGANWLGDPATALGSIVLVGLWGIGTAVIIFLAALQDVSGSQLEAATIDGAGAWRRFVHVVLPALAPALVFNVIIAIIWSLQVFAVPHIMTEGGPENATRFYTMYLYENAFMYQRMGYASAMAWLQFAAIVVLSGVTLIAARKLVRS